LKYEVVVGGKTFEIEVDAATVRIGARTIATRIVSIPETPLRRVAINGVSRTYAMSRSADGWLVQRGGRTWPVEITDERARSLRQMVGVKKPAVSGGSIRAPMPGLVLRLEVEEGQRVSPGTGLLVLEAMKMENEIRALEAGVVNRILVRAGQAVEKGTVLVEIAPTEQG
jgi:pyruvate carboxylase subunit B